MVKQLNQLLRVLKDIHSQIKRSNHKPWQIYFLTVSTIVISALYFEIGILLSLLGTIEAALSGWDWLVILGIQGILIGFVAESVYEQGDKYAKSASNLFGSKDRTLFFRIGVMTVISGAITKIVPAALENATEFLVTQTAGAMIALEILLVHTGSSRWNPQTEWPAIFAGFLLAVAPSVM